MKKSTAKKFWILAVCVLAFVPSIAMAATGSQSAVDTINNLKDLMLNVLSAIGVIAIIWGIVQMALGFHSQDGTQKVHGVMAIAGGAIIAAIGPVLTALGF